MENKEILREPEFITKEEDGMFFLEVKIPEELKDEIKKEVVDVSGAIAIPSR